MKNSILALAALISCNAYAVDLSRCHIYATGLQVPYGMSADGTLERPTRDPNLISYSHKGDDEKAVVKATANMANIKQYTYSIHSDHGKPLSYAAEFGDTKSEYTFGYDGDKCFVAEASLTGRDPISQKRVADVSYSKEMCDLINSVSKKLTDAQVQECGGVFTSVDFIRSQYQNKFAAQKRGLVSPMNGFFYATRPTKSSLGTPSAMDLITGCRAAQFFYPSDGITSSVNNSFHGFTGGITGNAEAPAKKDDDLKSTQPAQ